MGKVYEASSAERAFRVLLMGYRTGAGRALLDAGVPFVVWSDREVKFPPPGVAVYVAPFGRDGRESRSQAAALSGAYILRGRWGAPAAVVCACSGHLVWAFAAGTDLGGGVMQAAVPAAAPIAAVPLCLALDWAIRRRTGESAPTALLG